MSMNLWFKEVVFIDNIAHGNFIKVMVFGAHGFNIAHGFNKLIKVVLTNQL